MKHLSQLIHKLEGVHINLEILKEELAYRQKIAKRDNRTIVATWFGDFDLIVHANGTFQLIPISSFKRYKISDKSDNHCMEVVL